MMFVIISVSGVVSCCSGMVLWLLRFVSVMVMGSMLMIRELGVMLIRCMVLDSSM